jgi:hypothetical protein
VVCSVIKAEVVPIHTVKAYRRIKVYLYLFLILLLKIIGQLQAPAALLPEKAPPPDT